MTSLAWLASLACPSCREHAAFFTCSACDTPTCRQCERGGMCKPCHTKLEWCPACGTELAQDEDYPCCSPECARNYALDCKVDEEVNR